MHTNRNILHVIDTTGPGGAETVFVTMCKASKQNGLTTRVLLRGRGWLSQQLENAGIEVDFYDCKGSFNVKYLRFLYSYIRKHSIDIIHAHLLGSSVYCSIATLFSRVRVISTFHGMVDVSDRERALWLKMKLITAGCDHIISVSDNLRAMLNRRLGRWGSQKLTLISNGIDTDKFSAKQHTAEYSDVIRFACLGNIRKAKNYSLAIDFVHQLLNAGVNCHLTIAGDNTNELAKELEAKITALNLVQHIELNGFVDDTPTFLADKDVFLLSSSSEGHPLALNQALAMELPVLSTPCGVEQFFSSDLLTVAENFTSEALLEAFYSMNIKAHGKRKVNSNGRDTVLKNYSESAMIQSYLNLYGVV